MLLHKQEKICLINRNLNNNAYIALCSVKRAVIYDDIYTSMYGK